MSETRSLTLTPASLIKSKRQRMAWEDKIPLGAVTGFGGRGGEGKSSFALYLAAQLQAGTLEGDLHGQRRSTIFIGHEDDWPTVMKPRLIANRANLDMTYKLSIRTVTDEITRETVPAFPLDIELIRDAIHETNAALVIFDPITSTIGGDLHKVADVRRALDPLNTLAQDTDSAIIAIMHFNKGQGNLSDKLSGSHAFRDAFRSVMLFATDEETGQRIVTLEKSNYSSARGDSFAFDLESVAVETDDGETTKVAQVIYRGETDITVNDIVNRDPADDGDRADVTDFILEVLEEFGGSAKSVDVFAAGKPQYSEIKLQKARARANVTTKRIGFGKGSFTYWIHPNHLDQLTAIDSPIDSIDSCSRERESMESMQSMPPQQSQPMTLHIATEVAS